VRLRIYHTNMRICSLRAEVGRTRGKLERGEEENTQHFSRTVLETGGSDTFQIATAAAAAGCVASEVVARAAVGKLVATEP